MRTHADRNSLSTWAIFEEFRSSLQKTRAARAYTTSLYMSMIRSAGVGPRRAGCAGAHFGDFEEFRPSLQKTRAARAYTTSLYMGSGRVVPRRALRACAHFGGT